MTPEEIDAELEGERVCDSKATPREASPPADVQAAGTGRKPRRSKRRSEDPQGSAEVVAKRVAEMFFPDAKQQVVDVVLGAGRAADQRELGGDVSQPSEIVDRPLSFRCLLGNVSFNADGDSKVVLESVFDLEQIVQLKDYRNQYLVVEIRRA